MLAQRLETSKAQTIAIPGPRLGPATLKAREEALTAQMYFPFKRYANTILVKT